MEVQVQIEGEAPVALKLAAMVELQSQRIQANAAKGGWALLTAAQCLDQVRSHTQELEQAIQDFSHNKVPPAEGLKAIAKASADVSNYAFFIADNLEALEQDGC